MLWVGIRRAGCLRNWTVTEYGFDYELVTYKWPHWLRGQTEKQRTIWGCVCMA